MNEFGLKYFITIRRTYAVVFFSGVLDNFSQTVLEKCLNELLAAQVPYYILDLHGVASVDQHGLRAMSAMNQRLRQQPASLRVCLKNPELKEFLIRSGLVTGDEFRSDLEETLRGLAFKPVSLLTKPVTKRAA